MTDRSNPVRRRTVLKTGGASAVLGLTGLAGCSSSDGGDGGGDGADGGGDGGDGGGDGGDGGATTTTTAEPIVIGATMPQSGPLSSTADAMITGYNLGVEKINDEGGIDGREVELIIKDDKSEAREVRNQLQQLVSENDVAMLWGSFSSLLVTSGSAFAESQGIPFLGTTFAYMGPHLNDEYQWTFAPFEKSRDVARFTKNWFDSIPDGPRRLAIWELNSAWGEEQAQYWNDAFADSDYEVVFQETYDVGTSDFSTLISQTEAANADAILSNPIPPDGITAVKQLKSADYTPKLLDFVRATDPEAWWTALGTDGAYAGSSGAGWLPGLETPGNADLLERFNNREGASEDDYPENLMGLAFVLSQVTAQTLRTSGSTDPDAIRDTLLAEEFETVTGTFGLDENGMPEEGQIAAACDQWFEGRQMTVYPDVENDEWAMDTVYPAPAYDER